MGNTGYKFFAKLEPYFKDDGTIAGKPKDNLINDPDYIAPILDVSLCPPSKRFYSEEIILDVTKNNCPSEQKGTTVKLTIPANMFVSNTNVADANAKRDLWLKDNKQVYANNLGVCEIIPNIKYYSSERSIKAVKNNCYNKEIGSTVTLTANANQFESQVSIEDANAKRDLWLTSNAQTYANNNGTCKILDLTPFVMLTFNDIDKAMAAIGIADKTNINDWNTYIKKTNRFDFNKVIINGNSAKLISDYPTSINSLGLYDLKVKNIDFNQLNNITQLSLSNNEIEVFNPSSISNSLKVLHLGGNKIVKFDPDLPLPNSVTEIDLEGNKIETFNPTNTLPESLNYLNLSNNKIYDFNPYNKLPDSLISLSLNNNEIECFNPYNKLPDSLETLSLANNKIERFDPANPLPISLRYLSLNNNKIYEFNPSNKLPERIENLLLASNEIGNFDPSHSLPLNLKYLNLKSNKIIVFDPRLSASENLKSLNLQNNNIIDFSPSIFLNDTVERLILGGNSILNFSPLVLPAALKLLTLENNPITTAAWNNNVKWINSVSNKGELYAGNTKDPIEGTKTELLLKNSNWKILKSPFIESSDYN